MARKQKRMGPPLGNLNSAKHPWRSFWRRRALKSEHMWVERIVQEYEEGLQSDKPNPTEAEKRVMQLAGLARGCMALIMAEAAQSDGPKEWRELSSELAKFAQLELSSLRLLGLSRRTRPAVPELTQADRNLLLAKSQQRCRERAWRCLDPVLVGPPGPSSGQGAADERQKTMLGQRRDADGSPVRKALLVSEGNVDGILEQRR